MNIDDTETRLTEEWSSSEFEGERSDLFDDLLDSMFSRQGSPKVGGVRE